MPITPPAYELADFSKIPPTPCPCGEARRAFGEVDDFPGTIHVTSISKDAKTHYIAQGYPANAILFVSRERLEKFDPLSVEYKNAAGNSVIITEIY